MSKKEHRKFKKTTKPNNESIESNSYSNIDLASFSSERMEEEIRKQVDRDMMRLAIKHSLPEPNEPTALDCLVAAAKVHLRKIEGEKKKYSGKRSKISEDKENEVGKNIQRRDRRRKEQQQNQIRKRNIHDVPILPDTQDFIEGVNSIEFPYQTFNGEKRSSCIFPGCTKSFPGSSRVKRHYKTHFKVHPYKCSHCGRTFGRKDNMMQHMTRCKRR